MLLAAATSLPEVATDVVAVRLGASDLAAGDLFGSSMANMLILAVVDLLLRRQQVLQNATLDHALAACLAIILNAMDVASPTGSIFQALNPHHALAALTAIVSMSLGLAAIAYRAERRFAMIEPGSWLMVATYLLGLWLLVPR